jgi:hypothetical protein
MVARVPSVFGMRRVLLAERSLASMIPKKVFPADSRI